MLTLEHTHIRTLDDMRDLCSPGLRSNLLYLQ